MPRKSLRKRSPWLGQPAASLLTRKVAMGPCHESARGLCSICHHQKHNQVLSYIRYNAGRWTPLHVLQGAAFVVTEDQFFPFFSPQLVWDEQELLGEPRSALLRCVSCHLQPRYSTPRARPCCPLSSVSPAHRSVGLLSSLDVDDLEWEKIL